MIGWVDRGVSISCIDGKDVLPICRISSILSFKWSFTYVYLGGAVGVLAGFGVVAGTMFVLLLVIDERPFKAREVVVDILGC